MTDPVHAYAPGKMLCLGGVLDGCWVPIEIVGVYVEKLVAPAGYQHVNCLGDFDAEFFSHAETHPVSDKDRLRAMAVRARDALEEAHAEWEAEHGRREAVGNVATWEDE